MNAHFLSDEHGDPHFLFHKFDENNILNQWEKNWQKSMAIFWANEKNKQVQIMFPLKNKNIN